MTATLSLQGKRALVTGSGHGLGRAIAVALAESGADVVVHHGHSPEEAADTVHAISRLGRQSLSLQADVTDEEAVTSLVDRAAEFLGGIDILVTNAGHLVERREVRDMDAALFHRIVDVNLTSTFFTVRAAIPHLERTKGSIVTMSSLAGFSGGGYGAVVYAASKAAVGGFTRGLAKELGPLGIRVNAVAPGFIDGTKFHETFTDRSVVPGIVSTIPLGRGGQPEDVAGVVLFLSSTLAGFISGETIDVTGAQWMR